MRLQMKMNEEAQKEESRQKIYHSKRAYGEKVKQDVGYAKEEKE